MLKFSLAKKHRKHSVKSPSTVSNNRLRILEFLYRAQYIMYRFLKKASIRLKFNLVKKNTFKIYCDKFNSSGCIPPPPMHTLHFSATYK